MELVLYFKFRVKMNYFTTGEGFVPTSIVELDKLPLTLS
jgi:hypothetical protein